MNAVFIVNNRPLMFVTDEKEIVRLRVKYGTEFNSIPEARAYLEKKKYEPKEYHLTDLERAKLLLAQIQYAWEVMTEEEKEYVREKNKYRDIYEEQNAWAREHIREFGEE